MAVDYKIRHMKTHIMTTDPLRYASNIFYSLYDRQDVNYTVYMKANGDITDIPSEGTETQITVSTRIPHKDIHGNIQIETDGRLPSNLEIKQAIEKKHEA